MDSKHVTSQINPIVTELVVSKREALSLLNQRLDKLNVITSFEKPRQITKKFLDPLTDSFNNWDDYNLTLLTKIFSNNSIALEYKEAFSPGLYLTPIDSYNGLCQFYRIKKRKLESIVDRINLFDVQQTREKQTEVSIPIGKKIFIVHGHDTGVKNTVARFLENLDLEVIILHEKPDKGKTIIEKLEVNSSDLDIGYTVVLLTPDDIVAALEDDKKDKRNNLRARQNVIFELGYFIAKLGRERVRALYVDGVEVPSDYSGVLYTLFDNSDKWKLELAREMKAVGIELDMNKIK